MNSSLQQGNVTILKKEKSQTPRSPWDREQGVQLWFVFGWWNVDVSTFSPDEWALLVHKTYSLMVSTPWKKGSTGSGDLVNIAAAIHLATRGFGCNNSVISKSHYNSPCHPGQQLAALHGEGGYPRRKEPCSTWRTYSDFQEWKRAAVRNLFGPTGPCPIYPVCPKWTYLTVSVNYGHSSGSSLDNYYKAEFRKKDWI